MNIRELASIALVVLAVIIVAVIATSDISSLIVDPDYLGAVPGTLSGALRNSTYIATAYVRLHGIPTSLGNCIETTDWLTILREYELIVAGVLLLLIFFLHEETGVEPWQETLWIQSPNR